MQPRSAGSIVCCCILTRESATCTGWRSSRQVTLSGEHLVATSYADVRDYRENLKLVSDIAIGRFTPLTLGLEGNADRAWAELVSANCFDVLRVKPILGRSFLPEEGADKPGAFPIAVALVASYLPARRALRIDPIIALRCQ